MKLLDYWEFRGKHLGSKWSLEPLYPIVYPSPGNCSENVFAFAGTALCIKEPALVPKNMEKITGLVWIPQTSL